MRDPLRCLNTDHHGFTCLFLFGAVSRGPARFGSRMIGRLLTIALMTSALSAFAAERKPLRNGAHMSAVRLDALERIAPRRSARRRRSGSAPFRPRTSSRSIRSNGTPATEAHRSARSSTPARGLLHGRHGFDSEPDKWLGYPAPPRRVPRRPTTASCGASTRFLDERSGYFFEMNPSGLMGDAVLGVNGIDNRAVGRHLERARPAQQHRLDDRDRSCPSARSTSTRTTMRWGINFQRTVRRKNEDSIWMGWGRNQGLGRMTNAGRVSGIRERHAGPWPRHQAAMAWSSQRPVARRARPERWQDRAERRPRPVLQPDARPQGEPDDQHRLRADRGRSAAGQPHRASRCSSRSAAISSSTARRSSPSAARSAAT